MLDYFLSSDWAIIATELLAGFIVISLLLAIMLWRGQRRHTDAAERLLDDRDPITRASEEMLDRQVQRVWPELTVNDEQRETYAERSLDAVEAMVEPWLEPKRYELAAVARRFLQVRQADLDQLLTLARAQAEQNDGDDSRINELENNVNELREQRDRQAKQLAESLETVNVMVREYGRKFDYNNEPHVATVLKAIVMVQEMDAGADCETAKSRADEVFTEDLVASTTATDAEDDSTGTADEGRGSTAEEPGQEEPALSAEDEMAAAMAAEGVSNEKTDAMEATSKAREEQPSVASPSEAETAGVDTDAPTETVDQPTEQTTAEAVSEAKEQAVEAAGEQDDVSADTDDLDQLIESAAKAQPRNTDTETADEGSSDEATLADETGATGEAEEVAQPSSDVELNQEKTPPSSADSENEKADSNEPVEPASPDAEPESSEPTEAQQDDRREDRQDEAENGVIDLDDVEIPKDDEQDKDDGKDQEFDLDDIDALLDAEIARKHGKGNE